jgi:hypothetical protein
MMRWLWKLDFIWKLVIVATIIVLLAMAASVFEIRRTRLILGSSTSSYLATMNDITNQVNTSIARFQAITSAGPDSVAANSEELKQVIFQWTELDIRADQTYPPSAYQASHDRIAIAIQILRNASGVCQRGYAAPQNAEEMSECATAITRAQSRLADSKQLLPTPVPSPR